MHLAEDAFDAVDEIEGCPKKLEGKLKNFGDLYTTETKRHGVETWRLLNLLTLKNRLRH